MFKKVWGSESKQTLNALIIWKKDDTLFNFIAKQQRKMLINCSTEIELSEPIVHKNI